MMAERTGRRGSKCESSARCAGAPVRSPARSLAERARGFSLISSSFAMTGLRVRPRKLGGAYATSGALPRAAAGAAALGEKGLHDAVFE